MPPARRSALDPDPVQVEQLQRAANAYLSGHPADDPTVNAHVADLSGFPPLLIQAATGDLIRPDAEAFAERAKAHGVEVRLELYPADTHVFHVFWPFLPEAADALQSAGAFIRERLADELGRVRNGA